MKKFLQIVAATLTVFSLSFAPVVVHAQTVEEIEGTDTTTLPETGGDTAGAPDTGIAPSNNVVKNTAVFIGGSLLGAGIGFSVIALRNKKSEQ